MSDAETQEAINETLREIVERLDEKWEQERRKRDLSQDRHWKCWHWMLLGDENFCCEGKIHAYSRAKELVREYIERPPRENDPTLGERTCEIKKLPKE